MADIRKVSDLQPDKRNANKGTERGLKALDHSLRQYGAGRSLLVDKHGRIIAGNKTAQAAADIGLEDVILVQTDGTKLVAVQRTDLDLEQDKAARELAYADNRVGQLDLDFDVAVLLEDIGAGVNLDALWRPDELEALVSAASLETAAGEDKGAQVDRAEELGRAWGVQAGQLWEIPSKTVKGKAHRLLMGDCRNPDDVRRLCAEKVQGVFTSPPYAEQRKEQYGGVPVDEYVAWWEAVQANVRDALRPDGSFFVNIKAHCEDGERVLYVMDLVLAMKRRWEWRYIDELCWTHEDLPGAWPNRFRNGFEPVHQFALNQSIKFRPKNVATPSTSVPNGRGGLQKRDGGNWTLDAPLVEGMAQPSNTIKVGGNTDGVSHSAAFPVALPDFFIRAYSDPGDIWLDPFMGSGTVFVAAEQNKRLAYGMELLEKHGGVILQRLADMGLEPRLLT